MTSAQADLTRAPDREKRPPTPPAWSNPVDVRQPGMAQLFADSDGRPRRPTRLINLERRARFARCDA